MYYLIIGLILVLTAYQIIRIGKKYWHKANAEEVTTQNDKEEKE